MFDLKSVAIFDKFVPRLKQMVCTNIIDYFVVKTSQKIHLF